MNTCPTLMKRSGTKEYTVCGRKCKEEVCGYHKTAYLKKKIETSKEIREETKDKLRDYDELQRKYNELSIKHEKTQANLDALFVSATNLRNNYTDLELRNNQLQDKIAGFYYWKQEYIKKYNEAYEDNKAWIADNKEKERIIDIQDAVIEDLESKLHVNKHHKRKPTKLVRHNNHIAITTSV